MWFAFFFQPEEPEVESIELYEQESNWDGIARVAGTTTDIEESEPWWRDEVNSGPHSDAPE